MGPAERPYFSGGVGVLIEDMNEDTPRGDPHDEALLARLTEVVRSIDEVSEDVLEAARSSYAWRTIDAELAEIAYDSLLDEDALAGVRSGAQPRQITFESPDLTIELEVAVVSDRRRIVGQLIPTQPAAVVIRHPSGEVAVEADELGRFMAEAIIVGPVSLSCSLEGGQGKSVNTDWIVI
jgi:hypothetical protein